ncbi:ANTAR domain-containing response regulator [Ferrimicrobium acidiphilum]|jgi:response regulator NasT|uniref:Putative transcriptional regulatory protein pdtaR n=1 Tax=Ferrimicrobium acidiphilum DSM 19497 TaxID=1121877 RepID=A0A0D8FS13_9ACTN|nr:response regulator [Ferrimicrobium acidiphilum]KJE75921.1 putative transcriptional regulatory protein pdtaR [Ferrimicrobium acidiphilum DSM 19497]MCL5053686.1 response regulator [Gammaproteobacteria bacterium]
MAQRIIIAEDEAIIRRDLKEMLIAEGYDVVADLGRGDEALEAVRTMRPAAAVLDVKMPGMDGLSVAEAINAEQLCAVIILTAFSQRSLVEQAREAGVMAYLVKPFQAGDLVPAIELALARFDEKMLVEGELERIHDEHRKLEEKLETRVILDRAKARLMDEYQLSESDAFRFLQKTAMDTRGKVKDVAERVIDGNLKPGRS